MENVDDAFWADNMAAYDAAAKNVLAYKVFLARILKHCVREFANETLEDIAEKYIEGAPEIGKIPLAPDRTNAIRKIIGDNVEYKTLTEGETTFDIKFTAYAPTTGEPIKLIINIEAQRKAKPGYSLVRRGIFHGSRLMSAQYNVEFTEPDFDNIKKVISIWICMSSPTTIGSGITQFDFTEKTVVGNILHSKAEYDLMQLIMVYIGRDAHSVEDELLRLLHLVFRAQLNAAKKKELLRNEFDIDLDNEALKEVNIMCNLGEGLYEEAYEEGYEKAYEEAYEKAYEEAYEEAAGKKMVELTLNMLKENASTDFISRITGLSLGRIAELGKLHGYL